MADEERKVRDLQRDVAELRQLYGQIKHDVAPGLVSARLFERVGPELRQIADDRAGSLLKRLQGFLWTDAEQTEMTPLYVAWRNGTATNLQKDRLLFLTLKGLFQAP